MKTELADYADIILIMKTELADYLNKETEKLKAEQRAEQAPYDGAGWPGDGSGTDDLADYNANEAMDYSGE